MNLVGHGEALLNNKKEGREIGQRLGNPCERGGRISGWGKKSV